MPRRTLDEIYKKYEFNRTEPETLTKLIRSAIAKSNRIRDNYNIYQRLSEFITKLMEEKGLIRRAKISDEDMHYKNICCVGIDGSFQCVGGLGGIWYVPISISRVTFRSGLNSQPQIDVTANIEDINEIEYPNVQKESSFRMLIGETKALNEWIARRPIPRESVIFIDGPIVDPPWYSKEDWYIQYIKDRCNAIKRCLNNNVLLIGCVKRMMGKYLIGFLEKIAHNENEKEKIKQFRSDAHLICYVFTKLSINSPLSILYTSPINVSQTDETYMAYLSEEVEVYIVFMQRDFTSQPLRLDIPLLKNNKEDINKIVEKLVKISAVWTLPGHNVPLPVFLAHYKCNIRKGCAEVLYDEIITRISSPNLLDNVIMTKLRWSR